MTNDTTKAEVERFIMDTRDSTEEAEAERRDTDGGPNGYYWKPRAEEAEAKIARLKEALRAMLDATDAHRTDGKNTPKNLEAARMQASAVLASTPAE